MLCIYIIAHGIETTGRCHNIRTGCSGKCCVLGTLDLSLGITTRPVIYGVIGIKQIWVSGHNLHFNHDGFDRKTTIRWCRHPTDIQRIRYGIGPSCRSNVIW